MGRQRGRRQLSRLVPRWPGLWLLLRYVLACSLFYFVFLPTTYFCTFFYFYLFLFIFLFPATGSDDHSCRLFDLRADQQLALFRKELAEGSAAATSVAFSRSGRVLFAGYENNVCHAWDVLAGHIVGDFRHDDRVTCVGVSSDGSALCTSSWDLSLKIWAQ